MQSLLQQFRAFLRRGLPLPRRAQPQPPSASLEVEPLEDRCVPTTTTWTGLVNNDWGNGSNWSAGVPDTGISAVIPGGSNVVINGSEAEFAQDVLLNAGASLTVDGALSVGSSFTDQGNLSVNGELVMVPGPGSTTTIQGDLAITGSGFYSNAGTIQVANNSSLSLQVSNISSGGGVLGFVLGSGSSVDLTGGQNVSYSGTFTGAGAGSIFLSSGLLEYFSNLTFAFNNLNGLSWTGGQLADQGEASFTNQGTIVVSGSGGSESFVFMDNQGQLVITQGTFLDDASQGSAIFNEGLIIKPDSGTANIDVNVNNQGTIEVDGGVLNLNGFVQNLTTEAPPGPPNVLAQNIDSGSVPLVGGTWIVRNAQLDFSAKSFGESDFTIGTNDATIILDGPNAAFQVQVFETTIDPLSSLTFNEGSLALLNGASINDYYDFQNDGTLVLGTSAILNLTDFPQTPDGGFFQTSTGSLTVLVGGSSASGLFGQIQTTQPSSLDGSLTAIVVNGYTPTTNDVYPIIVTPGLTGTFASTQIAPLTSQMDSTTFYLIGTSTTTVPVFVVPPPPPPLVVPPSSPNNPPSGGGNTSVNSPTGEPASADVTGSTADQGGGSGGTPDAAHENSPLANSNTVALYFENLQWSLGVRMTDLSTMINPGSVFSTPPASDGARSKTTDANVAALPPILRFFIAAAGVGPVNIASSVNDGSTNVNQVYSILNPADGESPSGSPAPPKVTGSPAPIAPMPVRDSGGAGADGASRLGEPEESEGIARMLAVFGLALYHACATSIPARSPTARGVAVISSPWRSVR